MNIELQKNWESLKLFIKQTTGKSPKDLNSVLFLIGIQELGKGTLPFSKEQKQDLMHIAICKVLSFGDYYTLKGIDTEGWPHWEIKNPLPSFDLLSQENLLKHYVVEYFKQELGLHI